MHKNIIEKMVLRIIALLSAIARILPTKFIAIYRSGSMMSTPLDVFLAKKNAGSFAGVECQYGSECDESCQIILSRKNDNTRITQIRQSPDGHLDQGSAVSGIDLEIIDT